MSHNLTVRQDGRVEMAYYGQTPWHGLGTELGDVANSQQMMTVAGLDWAVTKWPLTAVAPGDPTVQIAVPEKMAVVRDDSREVIGVVGDGYRCIQNRETFELADEILGSVGAKWHTAGSLAGGRKVWALAKMPHHITVGGRDDQVDLYVLFANSFDGTLAWSAVPTPVRVVCWNTLSSALGIDLATGRQTRALDGIYIRHSDSATVRIEEARRVMGLITTQFTEDGKVYEALSQKALTAKAMAAYLEAVVPLVLPSRNPSREQMSDAAAKQAEVHKAIVTCFEKGYGSDLASARGTAWGAYNAVTEYVDHVYPVTARGTVSTSRLQASAFGSYGDMKRRALATAIQTLK